jgi:hypothetical protein
VSNARQARHRLGISGRRFRLVLREQVKHLPGLTGPRLINV